MPKVSVIIPVYNSSQYIKRCLQSVASQKLTDLEVILIDNCGTDDSIALAEAFIRHSNRKDLTYRIAATPTNNGPASARNLGLQLATGEYVAFLDADDWIEPDMYEQLYAKAQGSDMCCGNLWQDFEDGRESHILKNTRMPQGELTISMRKQVLRSFVSYFTTYIYRREWLVQNGIVFPDTKSAEDSAFLTCCLLSANRIQQTEEPFYHYIIHRGSLTSRPVRKGPDKRRAFRAAIGYAKRKGLYTTYRAQLLYLYIKKAVFVPVVEYLLS
ncbi:MAG: glycosyltransferase [Paludibacteraceae bacterium]|nr:glycosyltransferase [Paludibacteraceae bacterium]